MNRFEVGDRVVGTWFYNEGTVLEFLLGTVSDVIDKERYVVNTDLGVRIFSEWQIYRADSMKYEVTPIMEADGRLSLSEIIV